MLAELKLKIEAWAQALGLSAEHEWSRAAASLAAFIEGKQAETDAVHFLESKGYTVVSPQPPQAS